MPAENNAQILIRLAKSEDAQRIAVLCYLLGYSTSEEQVQKRLKLLSNNQEHIVYVAYLPDEPVIGWVHVYVIKSLVVGSAALIGGLIVNPEYRSRGAGRLLMQNAEQWAKEQGCETLQLRSNVVRQEAHHFYEQIGYTAFKTQLAFYKDLSN